MPSKPPETLYSPESTKSQLKPFLDVANPLLKEVLSYGLTLFARYAKDTEGGDENLPILFVFLHLLEMLDSVAIQIAECAPVPAALQLRAMFEALLTLEYLTQDKSKTRQRAMAYLFKVELQRKHFYLSQDPNSAEGKGLQKFIAGDPYSKEWKGPDPAKIAERVKKINRMLEMPELKEIAAEHKRLQKKYRAPNWYSLFGGPESVARLAQHLKHGAAYWLLYKEWSERTHGGDVIDRMLTHEASGPAARSLRSVTEINSTVDFAVSFAVDASRCLIRYYAPAEEADFSKWYVENVSPLLNRLPRVRVRNSAD